MKYKYRDAAIDLFPGDIILFRTEFKLLQPGTWLSAAIRFFTRCFYNHSGIIAQGKNGLVINEAVAKGIISRPLIGNLDREGCEIAVLRAKFTASSHFVNYKAMSKVGTPYDFIDLIIGQVIYRITGIWLGFKRHSAERAMVCSEYAAWCYSIPGWWYYSCKELVISSFFNTIFYEDSYVTEAGNAIPAS